MNVRTTLRTGDVEMDHLKQLHPQIHDVFGSGEIHHRVASDLAGNSMGVSTIGCVQLLVLAVVDFAQTDPGADRNWEVDSLRKTCGSVPSVIYALKTHPRCRAEAVQCWGFWFQPGFFSVCFAVDLWSLGYLPFGFRF